MHKGEDVSPFLERRTSRKDAKAPRREARQVLGALCGLARELFCKELVFVRVQRQGGTTSLALPNHRTTGGLRNRASLQRKSMIYRTIPRCLASDSWHPFREQTFPFYNSAMNRPDISNNLIAVAIAGCFTMPCFAAAPTAVGKMMTVDYPALVARADLDLKIPLGPADTENPGLPLGNGRLGTLLWMGGPNILSMQLNHTDVFAFRSSSVATRGDHQD